MTQWEDRQLNRALDQVKQKLPADSRWAMLFDGRLKVEDLDDEELVRGQLRGRNGRFNGPQPAWVPRQFIEGMHRESVKRARDKWDENLLAAQEELLSMAMNHKVEDSIRLRALTYIIERSTGKIPDKMEITAELKPWEKLLQNAALERDINDPGVVEGDVL